jgi:anthranilate/para-aminobenzoate synthase component II
LASACFATTGLFYSNGPGNPDMAGPTIENLKWALGEDTPIFGICMGHQLMGIAAGGNAYKMPFGNRGQNIPCTNMEDNRCYITPQNHGYAVDVHSLSSDWVETFRNANDGTNEGAKHLTKPFSSVQFHPEARGGPWDTGFLFDHFISQVRQHKKNSPILALPVGPSLAAGHPLERSVARQYETTNFTNKALIPTYPPLKKVLILGSGGLSIGQVGVMIWFLFGARCLAPLPTLTNVFISLHIFHLLFFSWCVTPTLNEVFLFVSRLHAMKCCIFMRLHVSPTSF